MKLILICIFLFSPLAFAKKSNFKEAKWSHIMKLLNEEIRSIKLLKRTSRSLEYRLVELYSERTKLYKELENRVFLKKKYTKSVNRKSYFKRTLKHYSLTKNYALNLIKKKKNHPYKAAIYYTLALNSRDFAYDNREYKYLLRSLRYAKKRSNLKYMATTALADYYYNAKKYHSAIKQYNKVIKNGQDDWQTKYLYNLSWCLLKTHKFDEAINTIERSFTLSASSEYIDVREQALSSITTFYVYGKAIDRGIIFLQKHSKDVSLALTTLATKTYQKGFYDETIQIFNLLENKYEIHKNAQIYADYNLLKFDVYNQYQKHELLLKTATLLTTIKLTQYQKESAIDKITAVVGPRQLILKKDFDNYSKTYNKNLLKEVVTYFKSLIVLNPEKAPQYHYYIAESLYSIGLFKRALASYKETLRTNERNIKKIDLRQKSIDAIFSCIENVDKHQLNKDNELEYAYEKYIKYWPNINIADEIYQRLYKLNLKHNNYVKADKTLVKYVSNYKKQSLKQRELYKLFLDKIIKLKNTELLSVNVKRMYKGFLGFNKKTIIKTEKILANILFSQYKKLMANGHFTQAIEGYKSVFHNENYPTSIKANAAFNIGTTHSVQAQYDTAFKWFTRSFKYFTKNERKGKRSELEIMANRSALSNDFLNAAKLEHYIIRQFCRDKKMNTQNFKNAISYNLANDYIAKTFYIIEKRKTCVNKIESETKKQIMTHLWNHNHEIDLARFISRYNLEKYFPNEIATYNESLFWKYRTTNKVKTKMYIHLLKKSKNDGAKTLIKAYRTYLSLKKMIKKYKYGIIKVSKKTTPEHFINELNKRINNSVSIKNHSEKLFEFGHPQISLMALKELAKLSLHLKNEMAEYQLPINDDNFQRQFKSHMNTVTTKYANQYRQQINQRDQIASDNEILFETYAKESFRVKNINETKRLPSSVSNITIELSK